ncbi:MAG: hypothetical protein HYY23_17045 [Verrucomicrobia bacterium]|nr:hypothetical protein [Verrucomicrobiota bacterium]
MSAHENLKRDEEVKLPSNRSLGLVFAAVFLLIGLAPLIKRGEVRGWALGLGGLFLILGLANASVLTPLNKIWMKFGLLLHHLVSPVILGILFYAVFTPMGWILRWLGKDPMRMTPDKNASSYWIVRDPPGPARQSMPNQF